MFIFFCKSLAITDNPIHCFFLQFSRLCNPMKLMRYDISLNNIDNKNDIVEGNQKTKIGRI